MNKIALYNASQKRAICNRITNNDRKKCALFGKFEKQKKLGFQEGFGKYICRKMIDKNENFKYNDPVIWLTRCTIPIRQKKIWRIL